MDYIPVIFLNFIIFIYGTVIGSFLNVLSDRLPNDESILGRSHCEKCKHTLSWKDLFPVFSFVFLKGRCRYCKTKLSFFYPVVEIITGLLFVLTWNFLPAASFASTGSLIHSLYFYKAISLIIVFALLVIFFADLKYQIIPDSMQVLLLICAVLLRISFTHLNFQPLLHGIVEGIVVMLPILLLFAVSKGRGMGFGDVKIAFVIGLLIGLKLGLLVLYLSFLIGAVAGVFLILRKKKKLKSKVAFGPFIVIALFLVLFFQPQLLNILKSLWGI